ncbi:MAG: hypothetical protein K2L27_05040 [Muribaculaceae bacterium]|nr:hypothetical protein [Muribaculaceae bacterium]
MYKIKSLYYFQTNNFLRLCAFALLGAMVTLLFSLDGSVLFPQYVSDYAVFRTMGLGWMHGAVPYRDLFDNKGPLHLLLQIVGQLIWPGKGGIWLMEVVCIAAVLEMLFQCGRVLGATGRLRWFAMGVAVLLYVECVKGGNTVETWSLPFQALALWLGLRNLRSGLGRRCWAVAMVLGMCFGAVALIRVNNNAVVCGVTLALGWEQLRSARYADLARCALAFIAGMVAVVAPFAAYFHLTGTADEAFYSLYVYSVHYNVVWDRPDAFGYFENFRKLLPSLFVPFLAHAYDRRFGTRTFVMALCMGALSFLLFIHSPGYDHYFLMQIPLAVLCVYLTRGMRRSMQIVVAVLVSLQFWACLPRFEKRHIRPLRHSLLECRGLRTPRNRHLHLELIPEAERDSIYMGLINIESLDGALADDGRVPVGKFFFLQQQIAAVDDEVCVDVVESFREARPLWVATDYDFFDDPLFAPFAGDYAPVASPHEALMLYRRVD